MAGDGLEGISEALSDDEVVDDHGHDSNQQEGVDVHELVGIDVGDEDQMMADCEVVVQMGDREGEVRKVAGHDGCEGEVHDGAEMRVEEDQTKEGEGV